MKAVLQSPRPSLSVVVGLVVDDVVERSREGIHRSTPVPRSGEMR